MLASVSSDLRFAARTLLRSPGFTLAAVLALALGIGANTAIFSVVDALLLRPLPFRDPDRLVFVWEDASVHGFPRNTPAPANYADWKRINTVFSGMAASMSRTINLSGGASPEMLPGRAVTANTFELLGVTPVIGRTFSEEEENRGAAVIVVSYALWQSRFAGDAEIAGKEVFVDGLKTTVVGVMPRGFHFSDGEAAFWTPLNFTPETLARRGTHYLQVVARLKPDVILAQAQAEMAGIARRLEAAYPDTNRQIGSKVIPLTEELLGDTRIALWVLLGASAFVMLIACANVANLLLARSVARQREIAVRSAIGAGRGRIVQQLLTESALLAAVGTALGLAFAGFSALALQKMVPAKVANTAIVGLNMRVLAFAVGAALFAALSFGLVASWRALRTPMLDGLKEGGRSAGARSRFGGNALVVAEMALALMLLAGAGLMIQTLVHLRSLELGFEADGILTARTLLVGSKYPDHNARLRFYEQVLEKVQQIPGVEGAGYANYLPFTINGMTTGFEAEGRTPIPVDALARIVTPTYLDTIKPVVLQGRLFTGSDVQNPNVVVVNATLAKVAWPNENPLGRRLRTSSQGPWLTVIGVVEDVRERGYLPSKKPGYYRLTYGTNFMAPSYLAIRTARNPLSLAGAVRQAIWSVNPEQPIANVHTLTDIVDLYLKERNEQMWLLGAFAALAVVLACVGIYGVFSYAVTQRRREIGVRMALGATTGQVSRMVLREGLGLTAVGVLLGGAGAIALTRLMESLLYGVKPGDPKTLASVAVLLTAVALAACWIPARRASSIEPTAALRDE